MSREPRDRWCAVGDAGVMDYGPMTANTRIDPLKLPGVDRHELRH